MALDFPSCTYKLDIMCCIIHTVTQFGVLFYLNHTLLGKFKDVKPVKQRSIY